MRFRHSHISLLILALVGIALLSGCRGPRLPVPPPVIIDDDHRHRPRHRIRHYRYRYFPGCQVYYDTTRKIYFYFSNNVWVSVPVLPRHIHVDWDDYVTLELEGPKPHLHHKDVFKRYPPKVRKKAPRQNPKKIEQRHRQQEKKEYRKEQREERQERRQEYRDDQEEDRYEKRQQYQEYREERDERREENRERRKGYRDDDYDDNGNDRRGRGRKDGDEWRRDEQPYYR